MSPRTFITDPIAARSAASRFGAIVLALAFAWTPALGDSRRTPAQTDGEAETPLSTPIAAAAIDTNTSLVKDVLSEPPPSVIFRSFGDNSLDFELRLHLTSTENMSHIRTRVDIAIKKAFDAPGIVIPFPQRDIGVEMVRPDEPGTDRST